MSKQRAYFIFAEINRERIKKEHPNTSTSHINREIANLWKDSKAEQECCINLQINREKVNSIRDRRIQLLKTFNMSK